MSKLDREVEISKHIQAICNLAPELIVNQDFSRESKEEIRKLNQEAQKIDDVCVELGKARRGTAASLVYASLALTTSNGFANIFPNRKILALGIGITVSLAYIYQAIDCAKKWHKLSKKRKELFHGDLMKHFSQRMRKLLETSPDAHGALRNASNVVGRMNPKFSNPIPGLNYL